MEALVPTELFHADPAGWLHRGCSVGKVLLEAAPKVRVGFREDLRPGAEGIDADGTRHAFGVDAEEVEREVPTPGVADDPGRADPEEVEHGDGVGHVHLD
jgi:hypothetical protein